jgi:hypothetical protein
LSVANSETFSGCGSVPESMLTTGMPASTACWVTSKSTFASVAAYTIPSTPWVMKFVSRLT